MNSGKKLLPIPTNQKVNAYLKELADICGIQTQITFHIARLTFASTVMLDNGVPIDSVSKMLGIEALKPRRFMLRCMIGKLVMILRSCLQNLGLSEQEKNFL